MKTFIYTREFKKSTYGRTVTCTIYRVKNNLPIYVGECKYNTGSTPGADSEVFQELIRLKLIPKSYYNLSKNDWGGTGYYCGKVEEKGIKIKEL